MIDKYRGKRVDNEEWIYGYFWTFNIGMPDFIRVIENEKPVDYEVHPETVGQCLGMKDMNKNDIYNGASIRYWNEDRSVSAIHRVMWDESKMGYVLSQDGMGDADEGYWVRDWLISRAEILHEDLPLLSNTKGG